MTRNLLSTHLAPSLKRQRAGEEVRAALEAKGVRTGEFGEGGGMEGGGTNWTDWP